MELYTKYLVKIGFIVTNFMLFFVDEIGWILEVFLEKNEQIIDSIQLLSKQQNKIQEIQRLQKKIDSIKMDK